MTAPAEPVWLTGRDVILLHERLLHAHGGSPGVRDRGLLESALARPRHAFAYGERDVFALAAAYAGGITRNHAFVDGNQRAAFMAAFVFLGVNGKDLRAAEADVVVTMLALTDGTLAEEAFARWLAANCPRASDGGPKIASTSRKKVARKPRRRKR